MDIKKPEESVVEKVSGDLINEIFASMPQEPQTPVTTPEPNLENEADEIIKSLETKKIEEPKPEVTETKTVTDYSKRLRTLIKDGIIDNFAIEYSEDGSEPQSVFIEDIETLTEEGYQQIIDGWKKAQKEEINSKYISVDGLDETTKKLIDIKKAGGDITEIIRENVTAIDNLTQLKERLDDETVQVNIVAHSLKNKGLSPKVIEAQIKDYIESGELESEATTIIDSHLQIHNEAIEQKRQAELQRIEKEKEELKILKKTLSTKYKEMNIPDNIQKTLVSNATQFDQNRISNTDKLYFDAIKDPERFAEINFFLNNPEEYKKYIASSKVLDAKIKTIKPVFTVNINKTNKPKLSASSLEEFADEVINKQ